jgi:hypothetical protein
MSSETDLAQPQSMLNLGVDKGVFEVIHEQQIVVGLLASEVSIGLRRIGEPAPVEPHHPYRDERMQQLSSFRRIGPRSAGAGRGIERPVLEPKGGRLGQGFISPLKNRLIVTHQRLRSTADRESVRCEHSTTARY